MLERPELEGRFCDGLPTDLLQALLNLNYGAATVLKLLQFAEWIPDEENDWESCFRCSTLNPNHGEECEVGQILGLLQRFPIVRKP